MAWTKPWRRSALIVLILIAAVSSGCPEDDRHGKAAPPRRARHVILFIGDGMPLASEVATSRYLYGTDSGLSFHRFPEHRAVSTWDVSAYNAYASYFSAALYDESNFDPLIGYDPALGGLLPWPLDLTGNMTYLTGAATDSASAATALATGFKTDSGNISWLRDDPAGGGLTTIAEMMRARGGAIGVVSTVPFSHATPAAFVSHNVDRGNYSEIAEEIINVTKPEVVIGGGHPDWSGGYITSGQLDVLRTSTEYTLVERASGQDGGANLFYAAATLPPGKKLFGLFGGSGGSFEAPVPRDNPGHPGFIIEPENPSLAEAAQAALMVLAGDTGGFFLMVEAGDIDWANHANNFNGMIGATWQLEEAVAAVVAYIEMPGDDLRWDNTLVIITADHATGGLRLNPDLPLGKGELPAGGEYSYATGGHTNELVSLYARGTRHNWFKHCEGLWYPDTTIIDNTQVFETMVLAAGLEDY